MYIISIRAGLNFSRIVVGDASYCFRMVRASTGKTTVPNRINMLFVVNYSSDVQSLLVVGYYILRFIEHKNRPSKSPALVALFLQPHEKNYSPFILEENRDVRKLVVFFHAPFWDVMGKTWPTVVGLELRQS